MQCSPFSGCILATALVCLFTGVSSVSCPTPVHPRNGRAEWKGLSPGDKVTYTCSFASSGQSEATCQKNGRWSSSPPSCFMQGCPPLPPVPHSLHRIGQQERFMYVLYHCLMGYRLVGHVYQTCFGSTGWSHRPPVCMEIPKLECSDPAAPANGGRTYSSLGVGSSVKYHCRSGHRLVGEQVRTCVNQQGKAEWSGPPPVCEALLCPTLVRPTHGGLVIASHKVGSRAIYSCIEGYQMVKGSALRTCEEREVEQGLKEAAWSGSAPRCELQCPEPLATGNGRYVISSRGVGGRAVFECNRNYTLQGGRVLHCKLTGRGRPAWSGALPFCKLLECSDPGKPANGDYSVESLKVGSVVSYHCIDGFYLDGDKERVCQEEGTSRSAVWSGAVPQCMRLVCPDPGKPAHGGHTISSSYLGGTVIYYCDGGYQLVGDEGRVCGRGQMGEAAWNGSVPTCEPIMCDDPGTPGNGSRNLTSSQLGGSVRYFCNKGHQLLGEQTLFCQQDGQGRAVWSGRVPACESIQVFFQPVIYTVPEGDSTTVSLAVSSVNYDLSITVDLAYVDLSATRDVDYIPSPTSVVFNSAQPTATLQIHTLAVHGDLEPPEVFAVTILGVSSPIVVGDNDTARITITDNDVPITGQDSGCGDPGAIENGGQTFINTTEDVVVEYYCNDGYVLVGSARQHCLSSGEWSHPPPTCQPVRVATCPFISSPVNGQVLYSDLSLRPGTSANFSCNSAYDMNGVSMLLCLETGQWDQLIPECKPANITTCPYLIHPPNGTVKYDKPSRTVEAVATFGCEPGFMLEGVSWSTCLSNGQWDRPMPACAQVVAVTCPALPLPTNGQVNYSQPALEPNTTASFSCQLGYNLDGFMVLTCQDDGQWDNPEPMCRPVLDRCPQLEDVANAVVSVVGNGGPGTVVSYVCNAGYMLEGDASIRCTQNAEWDNPEPSCAPVTCPFPGFIDNGMPSSSTDDVFLVGSNVTYSCNSSTYDLKGSAVLTCLPNGQWNQPTPMCLERMCPFPGLIENGSSTASQSARFSINATVNFSCNVGYRLEGAAVLTCMDNQEWSQPVPTCLVVTCPPLTAPSNGEVSVSGSSFGDTANFSCTTGYELVGSASLQCQGSGEWSDTVPTCQIIDCGDPGTPENGRRTLPATTFGRIVTYECEVGHRQEGLPFRICQENKLWSNSLPTCSLVDCGDPGNPQNGRRILQGGTKFQSNVTYECNTGFRLEGVSSRTCLALAVWSGSQPSCNLVTCTPLTAPSNGEVSVSGSSFGDTANFSCTTGYELIGSASLQCQGSGEWSDTVPTCQIIDCGDPGTPENSRRTLPATTFESIVTYECEVGHRQEGPPFRICQENKLWSSNLPTCSLVDCGDPGNPQNGRRILQGGTKFQSNVTYECNTGFRLEGVSSRTCLALAVWSGSQPSCNLVTCTPLTAPSNGEVSVSGSSFGDTANFSCTTGYELIGSASLQCQGSGEWSDTVPICQIIDCGDPGTPENSRRTLPATTFESIVTYECEVGHRQEGPPFRICQENKLWSSNLPTCSLVDCGDPGNPQNGRRILQGGTKFQSNVTYECNTGFRLEGVSSRTCLALAVWSGSQPSCNLLDCGDPGTPQNGSRSLRGTNYQDMVRYQCDTGFQLNGAEFRTCQESGTWTGSLPVCEAIDCGDPGTPSNGGRSFSSTFFNAMVHYSCNEGYELFGSRRRICQFNEQWSQRLPECRLVSCGDPGTPRNGRRSLTATTFNSNVTYECSEGYALVGPQLRQCLSNRRWTNSLPRCELIECPDPGTPDNGRRQLSSSTVGSQVVFECNDGYTLSGERTQECLVNGTWSRQLPSCEPVDCGDPGQVENAQRNLDGTTYGSFVTYTCSPGYRLTGQGFRTCQANGFWSGVLPECNVVYCQDPGVPRNGFRNMTTTMFGSTVEFSCGLGYELVGNGTRTCKVDGTWSGSMPLCQLASCPDPGIPPNSRRLANDLTVGSYLTYSCIPGYRLDGVPFILCLTSKEWTSLPPQCVLISCGDPGIPVNGFRIGDNFTFRSVVQFRCNDSYELNGNERRQCLQDGRWTGFTPRCVIGGCGDPGTPQNASRDLTGTSVTSTVSYQCVVGYRLRGTRFRVCQANGLWSGRLPSCELVDCGDPGVLQIGGRNFSSGTKFGSVVTYTCPDGFELTGTQNRTCQSNGRWSSELPACSPSGCGDPGDLDNGRVEFSNEFKILSMATYFCSPGYRLSGMSVRVCLSGGQWSSRQPSCELVDCGDPGLPRNGDRNLEATTFGSAVQYSCRSGYRLVGSRIRMCESSGRWSSSIPVCDPVDCGDPGSVQMGVRELLVGTTLGSTTIFKCDPGYLLEGSATRRCQANGRWSGSVPRCVSILCDDPGTPPNGVRSLPSLSVNSIVTYQCNRGYDLEGTSSRVCKVDGQWTGQLPTCKVVDCGDPGLPANSNRNLIGGTKFNGVVQYVCREGFRLQGSDQRQCQANGQWSGSLPICIRSDCGDPGLIASGQRELTGTAVGETANFSCFQGFRMEGAAIRECQQNGLWSGSLPTCTLIDCGDPGIPANGHRSVTGSSIFSSEVSYTCDDGFVLSGSTSRVCNESGWSGVLPSCNRVDCGDPGVISNGDRALGSTTFLSRVVYFCNTGYVLNGNRNRVCEASGNWSGSHPSCIIVTCGDPGTPSNGQRVLSDQNFGTEVVYTCDEGYELEGNRRRTCQARGEWSGQLPQCKIVDCGNPGSPRNGQVEVAGTSFQSVATCSCDEGFELVGEVSRVCGSNGEWSGSVPVCSPVDCGDPGGITNGDILVLGTTLNSVARYSCRRGYSLVGVEMITCLAIGRWSSGPPRCDPIDCGDPGTPVNGKVQSTAGTKLNSVVRYSCSVGYVFAGARERICQVDGSWSGSLPSCEAVNCGDPGTPSHGSREPDPAITELSNVVRYSCDEGYELLGSQERTCQVSGEWSGALPTCRIVDCGDPGSPNDGTHRVFSTTFGSTAHYECDSKFRLVGLEERICQASGQWSGSLPSCVLIDCGTPEEPQNGRVVLNNGTTLGARATYQCKVGFRLSSTAARVCLTGEVWSGTVPSCTLVDCGDPGTPLNAVKLGSRTDYLLSVVYTCSPGYALIGDRTRTCQASGLWTGALPVCKLVDCGDPGTPENGFRVGSNHEFGSEVSYTCDPGFQLSGSQTRSCQSSRRWSGTLPVCMIVTCGDPGTPSNGQRELSDQNFGTEVVYTCDEGYELEGSQRRICQASGEWSGQLPQCRIVDCEDPGTPLNGNRQLNLTTFGSTVEYSCNDGYELVGRQQRRCGGSGRWAGSLPVCSPTDCGDPGRPRNGDRVLSDTSLGSQVLYICNPGFEITGSQRRVCETSSSWSNSLPVCTAIECGDPGVPRNGSRQLSGRTAGSTVTFRCDTGFDLAGTRTQRCMDSGEWSDQLPECRVIDCRDPGRPHNGRRSLEQTTYQSTVTYSCNSGYLLVGEQSRQCQANGKWSGVLATCSPVECQDPGTPANGDRMLVSTTFTSTVFYSCRLGYKLEGNQRRTCQASGNWSGDLPNCKAIDCGEPGEADKGSVAVQGSGMGAVASYQCDRGYRLEGDSRRVCQASETWTGTVPTCRIVDCFDPGVPNNGLKQLSSTTFGSTVRYSCRQGYRLEGQAQRTCQASGRWSGTLAQCMPSECGDLGPPQDGRVDFSSTAIGSIASYSCSEGYTLDGTATRICQPNGEWSSLAPDCDLVDCRDPGSPTNGIKLGFATTYQSVVNYACRTGYAIRGESRRTCQASGEWTGSLPLCELVDCGDPGTPRSGRKTGTNYKFGGKVSYVCNNGFQLSGSQTRSCQASGSWSGSAPDCVEVTCGDPGTPVNGQRVLEDTTFDATVTYSCNDGYVLVGEKERQCGSEGQWSGPLPRCDVVSCGDPGQVLNAVRTSSHFTFASKVQFQCRDGYRLEGQSELVCLATRLWSHPLPRCSLVDCGDPGRSSNGQRSLAATTAFSIATYSCNRGYDLLGNRVRTCLQNGSWNGTIPNCRVVDCGSPGSPANGTIQQLTGTQYGFTVSYTCNVGYSLEGAASRVCQDNGQWSEAVPVCRIIDCRDPGTPQNGRRQLPATTFATTVIYSCSVGYSIKGPDRRVCQDNGRWSNFLPVCEPINCGDPGSPVNAIRLLSATTLSSQVQFQCVEGHEMEGDAVRSCQADGQWTGTLPRCVPIMCRDPGTPLNGQRTVPSLTVGAVVSYRCDEGYSIVGGSTRTCQSSGEWTHGLPLCQLLDCGDPGTLTSGLREMNGTTFRSSVTYSCNAGYVIKGESLRQCLSNGFWSGSLPMCQPVDCGVPGMPQNGYGVYNLTILDAMVTYGCNRGYTLVGNPKRTCLNSGSWSGSIPECRVVDCGNAGSPANGRVSFASTILRSTAIYSCDSGYSLRGVSRRECQESGTWSGSLPACQLVDCGDPGQLENGVRSLVSMTFGSTVTFSCNLNFTLSGPNQRVCQADGFWSDFQPVCKRIRCADPGTPSDGTRQLLDTVVGAMVTYSCHKGYRLSGDVKRTCQADTTWTGSLPVCQIVDCGDPGTPSFGSHGSLQSTTYGSVVSFFCQAGYLLRGESERLCLDNGEWSGSLPTCSAIDCGIPGVPDNGRNSYNATTYSSVAQYACNANFQLVGTDVRQCQLDGTWSGAVPVCRRIPDVDCRDPGRPANGDSSFSSTVEGSSVLHSCQSGYNLVGDRRRICRADGRWSGSLPECRGIDCGAPDQVVNGNIAFTTTSLGSTATYTCNSGATLQGDSRRTCQRNGQWSGTPPTCSSASLPTTTPPTAPPTAPPTNRCADPGIPDNAGRSVVGFNVGDTVAYACLPGFLLVGSPLLTCLSNRQWSTPPPSCQPMVTMTPTTPQTSPSSTPPSVTPTQTPPPLPQQCGVPGSPANGRVNFLSQEVGSIASYMCDDGFSLVGRRTRECEKTESSVQWSDSVPICTATSLPTTTPPTAPPTAPPTNRCADPGIPDYAGRSVVGFNVGDTVAYACLPGFLLVGSPLLTCLSNRQWSTSPPSCQPMVTITPTTPPTSPSSTPPSVTPTQTPPPLQQQCGVPGSPANGRVNFLSQEVGSIASYTCDDGFSLVGRRTRECEKSESSVQWSDSVPICTASSGCGDPGTPENGRRLGNDFAVGSEVVYVCNSDFSLDGSRIRICQANFTWTGVLPTCQTPNGSLLCDDPGAPQNGQRILITTDNNITLVYYECFDGFELVDGSSRRTCQPGGSYDGSQPRCMPRSRACEGSGIKLDQCGRRCVCINGTLSACSRTRLDFLSLTAEEKKRYLNTVKLVSTDSFYKPRYEYIIKKFETFSDTIAFDNNPAISQFFPWLRFYLIEYENLLRSVDCRIMVPFWDWTSAPTMPFNTSYFDNELGFGNTIDPSTLCVTTGPFRESVWRVTPSAGGECLRRELDTSKIFPDADLIVEVVTQPASDFPLFFNLLKFLVYNTVRCLVGGQMCTTDAPNDPAFLLLAARIDGIFDQWQKSGDGREIARYGSDNTTLVSTDLPVSAYNNNLQLPNGTAVEYGLPFHLRRSRSAQMRLRFPQRAVTMSCLPEQTLFKLGQIPEETVMWLRSICL